MNLKTILRGRQDGFSYASVVATGIIVGLTLAAYLRLVASQNQMTMRSQAWNRTVAVLEAGVEEALAHLNKNAAADSSGVFNLRLSSDGWAPVSGGWQKSNAIGDDFYVVTIGEFSAGNYYPPIVSEGYVKQLPTFASRVGPSPFLAALVPKLEAKLEENLKLRTIPSGYTKRSVVCATTNVPMWTKGIVARQTINLNGKNIETDSFDSSDPAYSTNRRYDSTKARSNGDVASNDDVIGAVTVGNAKIHGRVATGPNGSVDLLSGGVGSREWLAANGGKGIEPGYYRNDMNMEFPPVTLPFTTGLNPERDKDKDGIRYQFVFSGGDYVVNENLQGKILVTGATRIVVNGNINITGSDQFVIASNASLSLWMNGQRTIISGQGLVNGGTYGSAIGGGVATNFYYFGTANNTVIDLGGNAQITGAIYAPSATMTLNGSGTEGYNDFAGAAIVDRVKFNGHYKFHYDEALPKNGLYKGYVLTSWDER